MKKWCCAGTFQERNYSKKKHSALLEAIKLAETYLHPGISAMNLGGIASQPPIIILGAWLTTVFLCVAVTA